MSRSLVLVLLLGLLLLSGAIPSVYAQVEQRHLINEIFAPAVNIRFDGAQQYVESVRLLSGSPIALHQALIQKRVDAGIIRVIISPNQPTVVALVPFKIGVFSNFVEVRQDNAVLNISIKANVAASKFFPKIQAPLALDSVQCGEAFPFKFRNFLAHSVTVVLEAVLHPRMKRIVELRRVRNYIRLEPGKEAVLFDVVRLRQSPSLPRVSKLWMPNVTLSLLPTLRMGDLADRAKVVTLVVPYTFQSRLEQSLTSSPIALITRDFSFGKLMPRQVRKGTRVARSELMVRSIVDPGWALFTVTDIKVKGPDSEAFRFELGVELPILVKVVSDTVIGFIHVHTEKPGFYQASVVASVQRYNVDASGSAKPLRGVDHYTISFNATVGEDTKLPYALCSDGIRVLNSNPYPLLMASSALAYQQLRAAASATSSKKPSPQVDSLQDAASMGDVAVILQPDESVFVPFGLPSELRMGFANQVFTLFLYTNATNEAFSVPFSFGAPLPCRSCQRPRADMQVFHWEVSELYVVLSAPNQRRPELRGEAASADNDQAAPRRRTPSQDEFSRAAVISADTTARRFAQLDSFALGLVPDSYLRGELLRPITTVALGSITVDGAPATKQRFTDFSLHLASPFPVAVEFDEPTSNSSLLSVCFALLCGENRSEYDLGFRYLVTPAEPTLDVVMIVSAGVKDIGQHSALVTFPSEAGGAVSVVVTFTVVNGCCATLSVQEDLSIVASSNYSLALPITDYSVTCVDDVTKTVMCSPYDDVVLLKEIPPMVSNYVIGRVVIADEEAPRARLSRLADPRVKATLDLRGKTVPGHMEASRVIGISFGESRVALYAAGPTWNVLPPNVQHVAKWRSPTIGFDGDLTAHLSFSGPRICHNTSNHVNLTVTASLSQNDRGRFVILPRKGEWVLQPSACMPLTSVVGFLPKSPKKYTARLHLHKPQFGTTETVALEGEGVQGTLSLRGPALAGGRSSTTNNATDVPRPSRIVVDMRSKTMRGDVWEKLFFLENTGELPVSVVGAEFGGGENELSIQMESGEDNAVVHDGDYNASLGWGSGTAALNHTVVYPRERHSFYLVGAAASNVTVPMRVYGKNGVTLLVTEIEVIVGAENPFVSQRHTLLHVATWFVSMFLLTFYLPYMHLIYFKTTQIKTAAWDTTTCCCPPRVKRAASGTASVLSEESDALSMDAIIHHHASDSDEEHSDADSDDSVSSQFRKRMSGSLTKSIAEWVAGDFDTASSVGDDMSEIGSEYGSDDEEEEEDEGEGEIDIEYREMRKLHLMEVQERAQRDQLEISLLVNLKNMCAGERRVIKVKLIQEQVALRSKQAVERRKQLAAQQNVATKGGQKGKKNIRPALAIHVVDDASEFSEQSELDAENAELDRLLRDLNIAGAEGGGGDGSSALEPDSFPLGSRALHTPVNDPRRGFSTFEPLPFDRQGGPDVMPPSRIGAVGSRSSRPTTPAHSMGSGSFLFDTSNRTGKSHFSMWGSPPDNQQN